jgi:general secretion pathway protein B
MSYILDALKKSERQRRVGSEPVFHRGGSPAIGGLGFWGVVVGIALIAAALTAVMMRSNEVSAPSAEATPAVSVEAKAVEVPPPTPVPAENPVKPAPGPVRELGAQSGAELPSTKDAATKSVGTGSLSRSAQVLDVENIPFLSSMPSDFQRELPTLSVNIHVYSPDQAQCILYINNRQYHRGEIIDNGVQVMEIVPEGAVLQYQGRHFKLPRPS